MKNKWMRGALLLSMAIVVSGCGKGGEKAVEEALDPTGEQFMEEEAPKEDADASKDDETSVESESEDAKSEQPLTAKLSELPDFEEQIDLLIAQRDTWQLEEEEWDNPLYCVTDLDGNGRIEVIYEQMQGTGYFTDMDIYEVSEDKKSLISGYESEGEGPDAPDIGQDSVPVYTDAGNKKHYLISDGVKNGVAEYYETMYDVTFENSKFIKTPVGYYSSVVENYSAEESDWDNRKETYKDANEKEISEQEYENIGALAFPDAKEDSARLAWFGKYKDMEKPAARVRKLNTEDWSTEDLTGDDGVIVCKLSDEELRQRLIWSADSFTVSERSSWVGPVEMEVTRYYDSGWDEEQNVAKYNGYYDMIGLTSECKGARAQLYKSLNEFSADKSSVVIDYYNKLEKEFEEANEPGAQGSAESQVFMRRSDESIVSFYNLLTVKHVNGKTEQTIDGYTYDVDSGKKLALSDVIKEEGKLPDLILEKLAEANNNGALLPDAADRVKDTKNLSWTLDPDGICFYFAPGTVMDEKDGIAQAKLLFSKDAAIFQDGIKAFDDSYIIEFDADVPMYCDLDADGETDFLSVTGKKDEYETIEELNIAYNQETFEEKDFYVFSFKPLLVHMDDSHNYLFMQCSYEDDFSAVVRFDLAGGKLKEFPEKFAGRLGGHIKAMVDEWYGSARMVVTSPEKINHIARVDLLSTYSAYVPCHIDINGEIVKESDYWILNQYVITAKQDFKADELDESRKVSKQGITVSKGETLQLMYTDGSSYVDAKLSDGRMVRIHTILKEWPVMVDDKDINDVFDGMMFAG